MDLQALQLKLLTQRQRIIEEMGMIEPARMEISSRRSSTRRARTRSSEKLRRAIERSKAAAEHAIATGKVRKQLRGNAKFLSELGVLPNRLAIGTPLARVEGTAYHKASRRTRRRHH